MFTMFCDYIDYVIAHGTSARQRFFGRCITRGILRYERYGLYGFFCRIRGPLGAMFFCGTQLFFYHFFELFNFLDLFFYFFLLLFLFKFYQRGLGLCGSSVRNTPGLLFV